MYNSWPKLEDVGKFAKIDDSRMKIEASQCNVPTVTCMQVPTLFGKFVVGASAFGVTGLFFPGVDDYDVATWTDRFGLGHSDFGRKVVVEAGLELMGYAVGELEEFSSPVDLSYMTKFQQDVLLAIRKIPYGTTVTLSELAKLSGHPRKYAPVAQVVKHNPLPIFVPCHRVVPTSGGIGDYCSASESKRVLLEHEGVEINEATA